MSRGVQLQPRTMAGCEPFRLSIEERRALQYNPQHLRTIPGSRWLASGVAQAALRDEHTLDVRLSDG